MKNFKFGLENLGQDIALAKNLDFVAIDFDFSSAVLAEDYFVANRN